MGMRMIDPNIIKLNSPNEVYKRGNDLFMNENVGRIEIKNQEGGVSAIRAKVKGSKNKIYCAEAVVEFSPQEEKILDYHCECEAYKVYPGMCKHLVAHTPDKTGYDPAVHSNLPNSSVPCHLAFLPALLLNVQAYLRLDMYYRTSHLILCCQIVLP